MEDQKKTRPLKIRSLLAIIMLWFLAIPAHAHESQHGSQASYIANEGVMVTHKDPDVGDIKILFDPLPLSGFGTYMDVPAADKAAMMSGTAPYDNVDVVFISHAHRDHFSASDMIAFLTAQPAAHLVAPVQALEMMKASPAWNDALSTRMTITNLEYGSPPQIINIGPVKASAVRIAHAGWPAPRRAAVQNMLYRVTLGSGPTVMHMGDADVRAQHYAPYMGHWDARRTQLALPPYWFLAYRGGQEILQSLNIERSVGIHVPLQVPTELKNNGIDYFSQPRETRVISDTPEEGCKPVTYAAQKYTVCAFSAKADIQTFRNAAGVPFGTFDALKADLAAKGKSLRFAMNGGMYETDRSPVGLYIESGQQRFPLVTKPKSGNFGLLPNGVLFLSKSGTGIMETNTFATANLKPNYATQSGPMLVIDGKLHPKFRAGSTSKKIRNGVGISADGSQIIFAISEEPVNFHSFGRLFKDHLETPNALYLDGVISRLYDAKSGRNDKGAPMGPIIGVLETPPIQSQP